MKLIGKIDEVVRGKFLSKRNPVFLFIILLQGSIANAEMVQDNTTLPSAHWSLGIGGFNPTGGLSSSLVLPNWGSVYVEALLNWGVYGFLGDDPKGSRPIPLLGGGNLPVKNGALNARLGLGWIYRKDFPALPTAGTQTVGSASYTYRNDTSTLHEHYFPFLFTMEYGSDVR